MKRSAQQLFVMLFVLCACGCALAQGQTAAKSKISPEKALIGRWKSPVAKIEFKPGKKITINGDEFNFDVDAETIVVSKDADSLEIPYKLDGDTLVVVVAGQKVVYTRLTGKEDDGEDAADARPNTARTGGSVPQELVGKWCYMANVQAQNGGRQSNTCVTLNANGTYEYYAETSSSNIYGGAGSQTRDSGTWTATASSLTAHSNTGAVKTYTIQKRNHPKTGDPMLIVDGDAFVTFYQKKPW